MSTTFLFLAVGILFLAISSMIVLLYAIKHAEEGHEDATGYHSLASDNATEPAHSSTSTGDTGNPWDQVEGSSCPWDFKPTLRPAGHHHFSPDHS